MRPLKIAALAMGTIGIVLIGFLLIGFLLPATWEVERSAWIDAPRDRVFGHLDSAEAWQGWTPSPDTGAELFGPPRGEGSGRRWDDPGYGRGEFLITRSVSPSELEYRVEVEGGAIRIEGRLELADEEGGTRIRWSESGDFGRNPLLGYMAARMDEVQGDQLEVSLATLRRLVEEGRGLEGSP